MVKESKGREKRGCKRNRHKRRDYQQRDETNDVRGDDATRASQSRRGLGYACQRKTTLLDPHQGEEPRISKKKKKLSHMGV